MIDKKEVINFFNKCASTWDAEMIRNDDIISEILDNAGVKDNQHILDVACGTGVLFDDYLKRGVASVTGVDISPEMIKRARANYCDPRIHAVCCDIEDIHIDAMSSVCLSSCTDGAHSNTTTSRTECTRSEISRITDICKQGGFDVVMVYNAFPHFPDPEALIKKLAELTRSGGRISIAHGMSRKKIDAHHSGSAHHVSNGLMAAEDLRTIMLPYFDIDILISDSRMYQVAGYKRK